MIYVVKSISIQVHRNFTIWPMSDWKDTFFMNKSALIEQIAKRSELPISQSRKALDAILESITEALSNGDRVQLVGFGTFKVTDRKSREGRNPKTGKVIQIPASKTPSFTAGAELKKSVNGRD